MPDDKEAPPKEPREKGAEEGPDLAQMQERMDEIHGALLNRRAAELQDLVSFLGSKRRLSTLNFFLGLTRGVGFFLGFSLLGAALVAVMAFAVDWTAKTFESRYNTRTLVRTLSEKYAEVRDEIDRIERQKTVDHHGRLPSATGAQIGVLLSHRAP